MSDRRKKNNRVPYADYKHLSDALHQCTSLGNVVRTGSDGSRTPPAAVEPKLAASDADSDVDEHVDGDVQFFYDEADDNAAVHRLDAFAYEREFLPQLVPEPEPNFCSRPQCWWK